VDGYRLSFLIATGLAVLAAIIVALQLSSKSHRVEPGHQQADPGGPTPPARPAQPARADRSYGGLTGKRFTWRAVSPGRGRVIDSGATRVQL